MKGLKELFEGALLKGLKGLYCRSFNEGLDATLVALSFIARAQSGFPSEVPQGNAAPICSRKL